MQYKVCILSAGLGSRIKSYPNLHKSLLPLRNRTTISRIMDQFKDNTIVVALGYKSDQVRSYLEFMHPNRSFEFVYVDNYDKKGSGPGYSLFSCRHNLDCPFVFTSVDTLVDPLENNLEPSYDWVGVGSPVWDFGTEYCNFSEDNGFSFGEKSNVYIGMAGVFNYASFWDSLAKPNIVRNEHQVIDGFSALKPKMKWFDSWLDTGNKNSHDYAKNKFANTIVEEKFEEAIFIDNGRVAKFFSDASKVDKRVERASILKEYVPKVVKIDDNIYGYDYIDGTLLSNVVSESEMDSFISFLDRFMVEIDAPAGFHEDCTAMHKGKLYNRILTHPNIDLLESVKEINGIPVKPIRSLLDAINWDEICNNGIPIRFHGDLQPENILISNGNVVLLDWRDSFGKSISVGDLYYDFGKLYHAIIVNGDVIRKKHFNVLLDNEAGSVDINVRSNLMILMNKFRDFCFRKGLDWNRIVLLGILQWINISPMHSGEYSNFLYLFGKLQLQKYLENSYAELDRNV